MPWCRALPLPAVSRVRSRAHIQLREKGKKAAMLLPKGNSPLQCLYGRVTRHTGSNEERHVPIAMSALGFRDGSNPPTRGVLHYFEHSLLHLVVQPDLHTSSAYDIHNRGRPQYRPRRTIDTQRAASPMPGSGKAMARTASPFRAPVAQTRGR